MTQADYDRVLNAVRYVIAAAAAVAAYLMAQPDGTLPDAVKLALGAFIVLATFVKTSTVADALPGVNKPA